MSYKKITVEEFSEIVDIKKIKEEWFLIASEKENKVNTLTASWGAVGNLWNKPVIFIFVRPQRYTTEFLQASNEFTVTFFDGYKKELGYLGTVSGRDEDKISKVRFNIEYVDGKPVFKEGNLIATCKVLYKEPLKKDSFLDKELSEKMYSKDDFSIIYIGEIITAYKKEDKNG